MDQLKQVTSASAIAWQLPEIRQLLVDQIESPRELVNFAQIDRSCLLLAAKRLWSGELGEKSVQHGLVCLCSDGSANLDRYASFIKHLYLEPYYKRRLPERWSSTDTWSSLQPTSICMRYACPKELVEPAITSKLKAVEFEGLEKERSQWLLETIESSQCTPIGLMCYSSSTFKRLHLYPRLLTSLQFLELDRVRLKRSAQLPKLIDLLSRMPSLVHLGLSFSGQSQLTAWEELDDNVIEERPEFDWYAMQDIVRKANATGVFPALRSFHLDFWMHRLHDQWEGPLMILPSMRQLEDFNLTIFHKAECSSECGDELHPAIEAQVRSALPLLADRMEIKQGSDPCIEDRPHLQFDDEGLPSEHEHADPMHFGASKIMVRYLDEYGPGAVTRVRLRDALYDKVWSGQSILA